MAKKNNLGNKIKTLRLQKGISREEVAEKIGVKYSTYANYENGQRNVNIDTLKLIAHALDASIYDISDVFEIGFDVGSDVVLDEIELKKQVFKEICLANGARIDYDVFEADEFEKAVDAGDYLAGMKYCYYTIEKGQKKYLVSLGEFDSFFDYLSEYASFQFNKLLTDKDAIKR